jgi:predicted DsbA family dithiol-disulfide isomerase
MSEAARGALVEVYADIVCPFAYVGIRRLIAARDQAGADMRLRVHAWPLEWVNGAPLDAEHAAHEIEALRAEVAPDLFAGFVPGRFPHTSIPALGLAAAAYARDDRLGEAVSVALREAVFEGGFDVSTATVLDGIASEFSIARLDERAAAAAVRDEWRSGRARGVIGSPHFFIGDRSIFCPSLDIARIGEQYDVHIAKDRMHDFYALALG